MQLSRTRQHFAVDQAEVMGHSVATIFHSLPAFREERQREFELLSGKPFQAEAWYPVGQLLAFMQQIIRTRGEKSLFLSGQGIAEVTQWGETQTLEQALQGLVTAFQVHHRGGEVGGWRIVQFDATAGRAILASENPYPKAFELGVLTGVARRFRPAKALRFDVRDRSYDVAAQPEAYDFRDAEPKLFEIVWN